MGLGLGAGALGGHAAIVPASAPLIVYEGRQVVEPTGAVRLAFPGVTTVLHFRGETLTLRAQATREGTALDVSVDGAAPTLVRLDTTERDYVLVPTGAATEHHVVIVRRNENWQGKNRLVQFDLGPTGTLLPALSRPTRKLLFIGDSVTCGAMAAWTPGTELKAPTNANARLSFGMELARRLGAQCQLVSCGGRGVIRDWQGIRDAGNAPQFYERAEPDAPQCRWPHRDYMPDAIGIQLGTNDFTQGIPDQNEFVNAYVELIRKVQRDAPAAQIFLMDSPIVNDEPTKGPRRTVLHAYLEQVVALVGDSKVRLAPLSRFPGVPGDGHPTGADHQTMANELEPLFRQALGW